MATMTISVKFAGDNYGEHGNYESGHFVTNLPPEHFPIETAKEILTNR